MTDIRKAREEWQEKGGLRLGILQQSKGAEFEGFTEQIVFGIKVIAWREFHFPKPALVS